MSSLQAQLPTYQSYSTSDGKKYAGKYTTTGV